MKDVYGKSTKIVSRAELLRKLAWHRSRSEKVVFTNGCFDILHAGHAKYLRYAKSLGDVLVVGLNSDSSVRKIKGKDRPIVPQGQRAELLAALGAVDYVVLFQGKTPLTLIEAVRPDVLVKGEDWRRDGVVGQEFVEGIGGKVALAPVLRGISTTKIISKIASYTRDSARREHS